jgi:hypothetical protein
VNQRIKTANGGRVRAVRVMLNDSERGALERLSDARGVSMSSYLRTLVRERGGLDGQPTAVTAVDDSTTARRA